MTAGVGIATLGVGVGFLVDMFSTLDERNTLCPSDPCAAGTDRSRVQQLEADARRARLLGVVFSSAGGLLAVGGATMAWVVPRIDTPANTSEPNALRLEVGGMF